MQFVENFKALSMAASVVLLQAADDKWTASLQALNLLLAP
jgi:hypothetical protein